MVGLQCVFFFWLVRCFLVQLFVCRRCWYMFEVVVFFSLFNYIFFVVGSVVLAVIFWLVWSFCVFETRGGSYDSKHKINKTKMTIESTDKA